MPIAKLFIEGKLEFQVLTRILQGDPVLQQGGSKNSLRPRARTERRENKVAAGYSATAISILILRLISQGPR